MKYHRYYPLSAGMSFGIQSAYDKLVKSFIEGGQLAHASITELEKKWVENKKPYYRVPPVTRDYLLDLDITAIPTYKVSYRYESITFDFSEGNELHGIQSILAGLATIGKTTILIFSAQGPWTGAKFACLPFPPDKIIADVFEKVTDEAAVKAGFENRSQVCDIVQLLCSVNHVHQEPEVLARDQNKPVTFELVEKALRRGKVGWTLDHLAR